MRPSRPLPVAALGAHANVHAHCCCCLRTKWISLSRAVYSAAFGAAGSKKLLSGPDWSDATMAPEKLQW